MAGERVVGPIEQQRVHAGEEQHGLALRDRRRQQQAGQLVVAGDACRQAGVQGGPLGRRAPELGEHVSARVDGHRGILSVGSDHCDAVPTDSSGNMAVVMDLLADLEARRLLQESTDRRALAARLAPGQPPISLYYGCDPSADSLHHGNLIGLIMLRRFQDAGPLRRSRWPAGRPG